MENAPTIDSVIARMKFGNPSAAKRGRNPLFPWVPIVDHGEQATGVHATRTEQIRAKAFISREQAVSYAERVIDARRIEARRKLLDPCHRAFREQWGLPREVAAL